MRDPVVALYVVLGLIAIAGSLVAARLRGLGAALLLVGMNAVLWAVAVLAYPLNTYFHPAKAQSWVFDVVAGSAVAVVNLLAVLSPHVTTSVLDRFRNSRWTPRAGLVLLATLLPLAVLEWAATSVVKAGLVKPFVPMETRLAVKTEDWRLYHVMSDDYREPDPLLLWRPVARPPYGTQRFRGADVTVPKPAGVTRIMCYGDSNTDGAQEDQPWPNDLNAILRNDRARVEVVNAGVAGYSSYQGLQRFREEVGIYGPDVVFVSFGWDDVAPGLGAPDRTFAASNPSTSIDASRIALRRLLLKYRSVLVAERYLAPAAVDPETAETYTPRVSLEEYAANLKVFISTARAHGAVPVLLTRPYRESTEQIERNPSWRRLVPAYNRTVTDVAKSTDAIVVDVRAAFAGHRELFIDECHFTPEGHRVMARLLADRLRRAGVVP